LTTTVDDHAIFTLECSPEQAGLIKRVRDRAAWRGGGLMVPPHSRSVTLARAG
jgi:hypothetical protein